jgi:hypothetical protein
VALRRNFTWSGTCQRLRERPNTIPIGKKKDAPDGGLEEDVDPEDRVDTNSRYFLWKFGVRMTFVSVYWGENEKKRDKQAVSVSVHDDGSRGGGWMEAFFLVA